MFKNKFFINKKDLFLTVHSGTLGMYMPYAYNEKEGYIHFSRNKN